MNAIDLIYILLVLGGLALGFFQGTIKLVIAIVCFYVAIILSSQYFQIVGNFYRVRFHSSVEVSQITAFASILLFSFLLLTIAGLYTFRYARMPASLDFIDRIAGTLLGLVMGALFMGMLAILLKDLFVFRSIGDLNTLPIMAAFQKSVRSSFLVEFFASNILPLIYSTARPVLPREAELIFRIH